MSAIFQRPLCDMGKAYDYSFRPAIGDADVGSGGPCDDRPRAVELCAAGADPKGTGVAWRSFSLCPEHEEQLRRHDRRFPGASRFRVPAGSAPPVSGSRR